MGVRPIRMMPFTMHSNLTFVPHTFCVGGLCVCVAHVNVLDDGSR